ncbi:MAG: neuromedin U [Spirochaetes bacterium]|nr:MAG: neuromedin U [Spirochaetota bacterium]
MKKTLIKNLAMIIIVLGITIPGFSSDATEIAKKSQNPVSKVYNLPIQSNVNFGADAGTQWVNLIQPVIPQSMGSKLNWIHRLIIPVPFYQPVSDIWGMGDVQYQAFISPANPGPVIWGVGPYVNFPTATNETLGSGKWSAGPALLLLSMPGQWVFGGLLTQLWSFAGNGHERDKVSTMGIQIFINYNIPESGGWYITSSPPGMTVNWNAADGEKWTIPLGAGIGKMILMKKIGFDAKIQFYGFAAAPTGGPTWGMQIQGKFMFPKGTK